MIIDNYLLFSLICLLGRNIAHMVQICHKESILLLFSLKQLFSQKMYIKDLPTIYFKYAKIKCAEIFLDFVCTYYIPPAVAKTPKECISFTTFPCRARMYCCTLST